MAKNNAEALIYQAWEDMQALVESSQKTTKTLRRQEQRRKAHQKSQKVFESLKKEDPLKTDDAKHNAFVESDNSNDDLDEDLYYEDID